MSTAQTFAETFVAPARGLAGAADRGSFLPPIVAATVVSLALAFVLVPRVDHERTVNEQLDKNPQAAQQLSPHDREEAVAKAQKLGGIGAYAGALFLPALRALAVAFATWVAFQVAGAKPPFAASFAVASWALVPLALRALLSIPALLRMQGIAAQEADRALPSSLAALLPADAAGPIASLAGALDLFAVWSLVLVALGMAHVAGVTRRRAFAVVTVLFASYVLLVHLALPRLAGGGS